MCPASGLDSARDNEQRINYRHNNGFIDLR